MRVAVVFACLGIVAAPVGAGDWPHFRGPERDGINRDAVKLAPTWPASGPKRLWSHDVGSGFAGPAIADGKVVFFDRAGDQERVVCRDVESGKELWTQSYATDYHDDFGFSDGPRVTPVVHRGKVVTLGAAGTMTAWDLATGQRAWSRPLMSDYGAAKGYFGIGSTPVVLEDLVAVNIGGARQNAGIVALDLATGRERWRATDHEAGYSGGMVVTVDHKPRLLFFTRLGVVLLDPTDGKELFAQRWRARMQASVNAALPVVVGDEALVTASYNTGALLLKLGGPQPKAVWSNDISLSCHYNTPVYVDGHLYGIDGRQEEKARLRCVAWATGQVRWSRERFGCASLVHADGRFFALTEQGELVQFAADSKGYVELARAKVLAGPVRAPFALADGRLFARDDGKLLALDLR